MRHCKIVGNAESQAHPSLLDLGGPYYKMPGDLCTLCDPRVGGLVNAKPIPQQPRVGDQGWIDVGEGKLWGCCTGSH